VAPGTPEQFGAFVKTEMAKWAAVIKRAGIKPD
jgi:tripartite-type tricarboxylate transporter receptor subunit TctC